MSAMTDGSDTLSGISRFKGRKRDIYIEREIERGREREREGWRERNRLTGSERDGGREIKRVREIDPLIISDHALLFFCVQMIP